MPANNPPPTTRAASSSFPIADPPDFPLFAGLTSGPRAFPFFATPTSSLALREQYALSATLAAPAPAWRQGVPRAGEEPDRELATRETLRGKISTSQPLTWQNIDAMRGRD